MQSHKTQGWNSYLDWAAQEAGAYGPSPIEQWEPVFVRSQSDAINTEDFFSAIDSEAGYTYDPFEKTFNDVFRATGEPVEAFLYRKHSASRPVTSIDGSFEVLHVGALMARPNYSSSQLNSATHTTSVPAAIGIIDDGISYLHPRFQHSLGQTRFACVLLQTLASNPPPASNFLGGGIELNQTDINAELSQLNSASEDEVYRKRLNATYDASTKHSMRKIATHGTLMLDMAAGADPVASQDADMRNVPLMAVQLPPESFEDTSGARMQSHILQGLRWMIYRAFADGLTDELIVNLSLGVTAGSKNGNSFLAQQMKREIERVERHFNGSKALELVFAYGNAYTDNLIARATLAPSESTSVSLAIQPDDSTAGFVELRLTEQSEVKKPKKIEVTLTAPNGTSHTRTLRKGRHVTFFGTETSPIARLYHTPAREIWEGDKDPGFLTLAIAPTQTSDPLATVASSGLWQIKCRNVSTEIMDLTLQVQRDDSPFSRNTGARQAYFDAPCAHAWNAKKRDFSALDNDCTITHEGSNSAFSTVKHDNAHSVGAAFVQHETREPSPYSAQGADWSGSAPDASAVAQTGRSKFGVLGAGTFATGTARLSGTSTAAASFTRHLVHPAATSPVTSEFDRLGTVTVLENTAIKDQRR